MVLQAIIEWESLKLLFMSRITGKGMSEEFQKIMFEPFAQEENRAHHGRIFKKAPVSPSIVKQIVDLMNGTIEVQSQYELRFRLYR